MERTITGLEDMRTIARELVSGLVPTSRATLVTLSGELGAGKTTLSQMIGNELGIEEAMASPTFVLEKVYELTDKSFKHLVHIDAYRLTEASELSALGFDEIIRDRDNLVLLEWPEKVEGGLPPADVAVKLAVNEDASRTLTMTYA